MIMDTLAVLGILTLLAIGGLVGLKLYLSGLKSDGETRAPPERPPLDKPKSR